MVDHVSDYYGQDIITPAALYHGYDFGSPAGSPEYAYNFIDYYFEDETRQVFARHYLDSAGEVQLNVEAAELASPLLEKILIFLGLRYEIITLSGGEALPESILRNLRDRLASHIRTNGI